MLTDEVIILFKFGKKEHLESLQNGLIYFNSVSNYRKDGTAYRGDSWEGATPIDPTSFRINGKDFSDITQSIKKTYEGDEKILMFCASMLNNNNIIKVGESYKLAKNFREEMEQFGTHVLVFNFYEITHKLSLARKKYKPEFAFRTSPITYRDLSDFSSGGYFKSYNSTGHLLDSFFVKSDEYKKQNEWRIILAQGSHIELPINKDGSFHVSIEKLEHSVIFDVETFFDTFELKQNKT